MSTRVLRGYNPLTMGIIGLKALRSASLVSVPGFDKTGDEVLYHVSLARMSDWLLDSSVSRGNYMVYHYDFPNYTYMLRPPWRSALAEAFCGIFLVAYGTARHDDRYLNCGVKHLRSMPVPVSKGGVKSDDSALFLEYVDYGENRRWPVVLNGHLYSMVTLLSASNMLDAPEFRFFFDQALLELRKILPAFDGPFFSYYDSYGNPATPFYHRIHVHLLDRLYVLTGAGYVRKMAGRWRGLMPKYRFTLSLLMRAYSMRIPYLPKP